MGEQHTYRVRTQAELEEALQRFIDHAWQKPTGPLFHIPVDEAQDADIILGDGIKELITLRAKVQEQENTIALHEQAAGSTPAGDDSDNCENCREPLPIGCDKYCDDCLSNWPLGYPPEDGDEPPADSDQGEGAT